MNTMDKILEKIIETGENLENPKHPLLGPNLKGLYLFGLWQCGTKLRKSLSNCVHVCSILFVVSQFIDLYEKRDDMMQALMNLSMTGFSSIAACKTMSFVTMQARWVRLVQMVSVEEISQIKKNEANTMKLMAEYKKYSRTITYGYWILVMLTTIVTLLSPGLKYISAAEYREKIRNRTESYPQILDSWFPFDGDKMAGYVVITIVHILMTCQGAGIVATYDANAVAVVTYIKGQLKILRSKVQDIFGDAKPVSEIEVRNRIKDCHRLHNHIMEVFNMLNSLLSPVMFLYVLICSITICCGVVQLSSKDASTSQKLWVVEFVLAQVFQLFLYCWHSNEVTLEANAASRSILQSNLWRSDLKERRFLILLAGKLEQPCVLAAGPFTSLSIPTFIDIIKGSYSFYTLFTQMQENKSP